MSDLTINKILTLGQELETQEEQKIQKYWEDNVSYLEDKLNEAYGDDGSGKPDLELRQLVDLMRAAILEYDQYKKVPLSESYIKCTRLVQVRMPLSRESIHLLFRVKTYSMNGIGLYIPLEGILISSSLRKQSNWDDSQTSKKVEYNMKKLMPDWFGQEYVQRLAMSADNGLFIPKRCKMIDDGWIDNRRQLSFFDLSRC